MAFRISTLDPEINVDNVPTMFNVRPELEGKDRRVVGGQTESNAYIKQNPDWNEE